MKKRRLIAVLLAAFLLISALPVTVFAAGTTYTVTVNNNGEPITVTGTVGENAASTDADYTVNIVPQDRDKCLVYRVSVRSGFSYLGSASYTYNAETGDLTVFKEHIYGNTTISVYTAKRPQLTAATEIAAPYTASFRYTEAENNTYAPYAQNCCPVRMYRMDLAACDRLNVWFYADGAPTVDTAVELYRLTDTGTLTKVGRCDENDYPVNASAPKGEVASFPIAEDGTYILFACSLDAFDTIEDKDFTITVSLSETSIALPSGAPQETEQLDFTNPDDLPTPSADSLWSWDQTTKTLTLQDGFYIDTNDNSYYTRINAIVLPVGADVVVEGAAYIASDWMGIAVYKPQEDDAEYASEIRLKAGAELNILSSYTGIEVPAHCSFDVTGAADAKGALPELNIQAQHKGIQIGDRSLSLKNLKLDIVAVDDALMGGSDAVDIVLENCRGSIFSTAGSGVFTNGFEVNEADISIDSSTLYIRAALDALCVEGCGNVTVTDSDLTLLSENGIGICISYAAEEKTADVKVSGGSLVVKAYKNAIFNTAGKVQLDDTVFYLETLDTNSHHTLLSAYGDTMSLDGTFRFIDEYGKEAYVGEWAYPNLKEIYKCGIADIEGYGATAVVCSVLDAADCGIEGMKTVYTRGENAAFTAVAGLPAALIHANEGYLPVSWEVVGTELTGSWAEKPYGASFDTDTLAYGETYTLRVVFKKATYVQFNGWERGGWQLGGAEEIPDEDAAIARAAAQDTVTRTFTFKIAEDTTPVTPIPTPKPTTPPTGGTSTTDKDTAADADKTPAPEKVPQTGVSALPAVYAAILMITAAAAAVCFRKKRTGR